MKSISSVLKRRKKTRNIFLTKKQAYILHSIHRKGRGNNLCLPKISAATTVIATSTTEQEQYDNDPAGIIAIAAAASVSTSIRNYNLVPPIFIFASSYLSSSGFAVSQLRISFFLSLKSCSLLPWNTIIVDWTLRLNSAK